MMGTRGHRGQQIPAASHTEESIQRAIWQRKPILTNPAFEMMGFLAYAWESDYLLFSKSGYVYECEIKISHADFMNEAKHKEKKMRLLGGWDATVAEYHDYAQHGIKGGEEIMKKPNYFYYVCPEGVIKPEELPSFAGLIYIDDDGYFSTRRVPAPQIHNQKHSFSTEYLRDKCYWAMWNWVRRFWNKSTVDISARTRASYEEALNQAAERISDLQMEINRLKA